MTTRSEISTHKSGAVHGIVTIDDDLTEQQVAVIANEAGGLSNLIGMGEWSGEAGYEPTGDDEYDIVE